MDGGQKSPGSDVVIVHCKIGKREKVAREEIEGSERNLLGAH